MPENEQRTLPMWGDSTQEPSYRVGKGRANYVAAPVYRQQMAAPVIDAEPTDVSGVWSSRSATMQEVGTPVHRALATLIRSTPIVVLLAILGIPTTWLVGWDWMLAVGIVGGFALVGSLGVLLIDLSWNAPGSTERHRVNKAYQLKRMELQQNHELRRDIVNAYLASLERQEGE
jgi:hypothetical protein